MKLFRTLMTLYFCGSTVSSVANVSSISDVSETLDVLGIRRSLEFYSSEKLAENFDAFRTLLTTNCSDEVFLYVQALKDGEKWALKLDDASGRYSNGWYWGNQFWIGSQSLCENTSPRGHKTIVEEAKGNSTVRKTREARISPSQSEGYKTGSMTYSALAPYPVSYFTLKIKLNATYASAETKNIQLGLCLPLSCQDKDVRTIVEETASTFTDVNVHVLGVKSEHQYYDVFKDTTFRILCVITGIIVILLIAGTSFDIYLSFIRNKKNICYALKCTTYTNTELPTTNDKHIKLNPSDVDAKNGKCCMNVENNNNNSNNVSEHHTEICAETKMATNQSDSSLICSVLKDLLLSFSLRKNINSICDRTVGSDTISSIHGLKAVSMVWVILGHTCIIGFKYSDNMEYRKVVQKEFFFQTITNGAFSVDTFFFTSGLLVSFLYFRSNAKGKLDALGHKGFLAGFSHFISLVFFRFVRLSAPYMFVLGMVEVTMKWFNYNSIFDTPTMDHVNCPKYWWRNLLYINTLFPDDQMCMLWSWYLSDDTQFYVLGAILLILATRVCKIIWNLYISSSSTLIIADVQQWLAKNCVVVLLSLLFPPPCRGLSIIKLN